MEPIACKLAPSDFAVRAAEIRALFEAEVVGVDRSERQVVWRFRPSPQVRRRFAAMAAAEAECCSFLQFEVGTDRLTITAPEGAEAALAELFG